MIGKRALLSRGGFDVNESLAARRFMALVTLHVSQRFDGVPGRR